MQWKEHATSEQIKLISRVKNLNDIITFLLYWVHAWMKPKHYCPVGISLKAEYWMLHILYSLYLKTFGKKTALINLFGSKKSVFHTILKFVSLHVHVGHSFFLQSNTQNKIIYAGSSIYRSSKVKVVIIKLQENVFF